MDNYFTLYGLSETFHPDAGEVRKRYYALSRQYHPDHFVTADEATRQQALERSSMNNEAYQTLTDPDKTMAYLLRQHGLLDEEEQQKLPPQFLMEMMELNEAVSDYESDPGNEALAAQSRSALQEQLTRWAAETQPLTQGFDAGDRSEGLLARIREAYLRRRYLLRIQHRMDTFAGR